MTQTCSSCGMKTDHAVNAVIGHKFAAYCPGCVAGNTRQSSAQHAQYSRDRDREDNAQDLLQPWDRHGKPNREFIIHYPEEAKDMFSEKELNDNG